MSTFKTSAVIISCFCLVACKGPHYLFGPKDVSSQLWQNEQKLSELDGGNTPVLKIKKVFVYSAELTEVMTEQNGVSNYQVVNKNSATYKDQKLPVNGYSHRLYLLVFLIEPEEKPTVAVYFSTSYNKKGRCIGIDPIYIGELNDQKIENDVFLTRRYLKIRRVNDHYEFAGMKNDSVNLRFEADHALVPGDFRDFTFKEVIQGYNNTITGKEKKIIYRPDEIFPDRGMLYFKLQEVITP